MPSPTRTMTNMDIWRRHTSVHAHLMSYLARELTRATGLSEADYQILDALLDAPGQRARALELRWTLQWEKSRLSHQVARMVSRGLLDRAACAEDARGANVALSAAGREAAMRARRVREESVERVVFATLGGARLAALAEATDLLAERLALAAQEDPECRAAYAEAVNHDEENECGEFDEKEGAFTHGRYDRHGKVPKPAAGRGGPGNE